MINTDIYTGHTPGPWTYNNIEGRAIWKCLFNGECFTDPSTYGRPGYEEVVIAEMAPLPEDGEDFPEEEFTTMMANKMLMADAPRLLAEVKRLSKQLDDCKRQIKETADWIRDRGEDTHAKGLDEFLEWME